MPLSGGIYILPDPENRRMRVGSAKSLVISSGKPGNPVVETWVCGATTNRIEGSAIEHGLIDCAADLNTSCINSAAVLQSSCRHF